MVRRRQRKDGYVRAARLWFACDAWRYTNLFWLIEWLIDYTFVPITTETVGLINRKGLHFLSDLERLISQGQNTAASVPASLGPHWTVRCCRYSMHCCPHTHWGTVLAVPAYLFYLAVQVFWAHVCVSVCPSARKIVHERSYECGPISFARGDPLGVIKLWCWSDFGCRSRITVLLSLT